jgi:hypothetical protein
VEALGSSVLIDTAREIARGLQVPIDMPGMLILGVLAIAAQRTFRVSPKNGWEEALCLFILITLPPSERKSPVLKMLRRGIDEAVEDWNREHRPAIQHEARRRRVLETKISKAEKEATTLEPGPEQDEAMHDAETLQAQLDGLPGLRPKRAPAADITPEAVPIVLQENAGEIALLSAEGQVFEALSRYQAKGAGANVSCHCEAWGGEPISVDRVGRDSVFVQDPVMSIVCCAQPYVREQLLGRGEIRGKGLAARILYSEPEPMVGSRDVRAEPPDEAVIAKFAELIKLITAIDRPRDENDQPSSHVIGLSPAARQRFEDYEDEYEGRLAVGGDLNGIDDWAGKAMGQSARIAAVIHIAKQVMIGNPADVAISDETVSGSLQMVECLAAHAKLAMGPSSAEGAKARKVVSWIKTVQRQSFTRRELHQQIRGSAEFKTVDCLDEPLRELEERGYIRWRQPEKSNEPGPRSVVFDVNPLVLNPHNPQDPGP